MKKQLLGMMLLAGALLVGCQSNSVEPVEPTEEVVVNEQDAEEAERQAHIDEIRKSINGDQEEMTTEEYFEQQREQEREDIRKSAENSREYNELITAKAYTEEEMNEFFQQLYLNAMTEDKDALKKQLETYKRDTAKEFDLDEYEQFKQWVEDNKKVDCYKYDTMCKSVIDEYTNFVFNVGGLSKYVESNDKEESYLEIVSEIRGEEIEKGLTYENFLLVGSVDFNSLYAVKQLFGEGELIGERGNIQQYRWTSGSGRNYKVVQIMFVDGQVESKSQSGLK